MKSYKIIDIKEFDRTSVGNTIKFIIKIDVNTVVQECN